ncbi:MAG: hypothetical protein R3E01_17315 [Pirellulaceae bacterium]|nr:hypothetical protein [Planctomycetales bacterium]
MSEYDSRTLVGRAPDTTDWWARLLSLGALALAGASVLFTWLRTAELPAREEILASYRSEMQQAVKEIQRQQDETEKKRQEVNDQALARLREATDGLAYELNLLDKNQNQGQPLPDDSLAPPPAAPERSDDIAVDEFDSKPHLREVQVVLRPNSDAANVGSSPEPQPTIVNDGRLDAIVTRVSFQPQSLFEVPTSIRQRLGQPIGDTELEIRFAESDNQATTPGKHGKYVRPLLTPLLLVPDRQLQLRVLIENKRHQGWAMRGELTLEYDGGESLVLPNASVYFLDPAPVDQPDPQDPTDNDKSIQA